MHSSREDRSLEDRSLEDWGWNAGLQAEFNADMEQGRTPARVLIEHRDLYVLRTAGGELEGRITGRLRLAVAEEGADAPAVGDWVAVDARPGEGTASIHRVLPRRGSIVRRAAGGPTRAQVLAANVDTVFLVTSLNQEFNPKRMDRFLSLAWDSGANPVVLLNKADLCPDPDVWMERAADSAPGVPIHLLSALNGDGVDEVAPYCRRGRTVVLLGSSGVGKSTLTNRLLGREALRTSGIREDDARGRHTTSHRELMLLPGGGVLIDTPGLREVALWESEEGVRRQFADVDELSVGCRFADCRHESEPGCAVLEAVERGALDAARFESYRKLRRELAYLERRIDPEARLAERRKWRAITKSVRKRPNR